ncbi:Quinonprotein alcohol dehydrogenase-like superfamily [Naviculisporaceae sp. PSN 640]
MQSSGKNKMVFAVYLTAILAALGPASASSINTATWAGWGNGISNNRWTSTRAINSLNVRSLAPKCLFTYPFGVSATPTVQDKMVYYPTWNGSLVALDYTTCHIHWTINVTSLIHLYKTPSPETARATYPVSRTSPQIDLANSVLYFATQTHALLVAVDLHTGALLGMTQINGHPFAVITSSPTFWKDRIFVGASSYEEPAPLFFENYPCCSFIGTMACLSFNRRANKFTTKWSIPTLPSGKGWSGAGVWGSQPSLDTTNPGREQVFFGTGNVYSFPEEYAHCAARNSTAECMPEGVNQEAVIAVDIASGKVNWIRRVSGMDAWNGACITSPIDVKNCPAMPPGRDSDFGMAPTFVPRHANSRLKEDLVVVGQKTGVIFAFSAKTGKTIWLTDTSHMQGGGLSWGIAVDNEKVYYTLPYSNFNLPFNTSTSIYGSLSLTNNGSITWEVPAASVSQGKNVVALQPPTVAGDLVFYPRAGIMSGDGTAADYDNSKGSLVVLDKRTGALVREIELETTFQGGIAVVGEYVLFGTGYRNGVAYLGNGSLHVMKVDGGGVGKGKGKGNKKG